MTNMRESGWVENVLQCRCRAENRSQSIIVWLKLFNYSWWHFGTPKFHLNFVAWGSKLITYKPSAAAHFKADGNVVGREMNLTWLSYLFRLIIGGCIILGRYICMSDIFMRCAGMHGLSRAPWEEEKQEDTGQEGQKWRVLPPWKNGKAFYTRFKIHALPSRPVLSSCRDMWR